MTKQPSYRFGGYTEAWAEKKLGEVNDVRDGTHDSPKYVQDGYPLVTSKNLTSEGLDFSDISFISEVDYISINKRSKVEIGDIIFGMIGTIGNPVLLKKDGFAIKNVALLKKDGFIDNSFLIQLLQSSSFIKYISLENAGGTQKFLGLSQIRNFQLFSPSLPEQTAIGSFFQDTDQLISLQQRKLEVLKGQKKTYLKLLFPAKGQTKPALRFAGFEDEWKEVKVSDIFRVTRGQVLATTEISAEKTDTHKYPVYSSQTKNEGLLGYYDKYLFETAITWTTDGANAGTVNYREGKFYSTNVNGVLLSDEGFANKVIAEILNNEAWKYVSKVGNPKLMNNVMSEISLVIPNDFREISTLSTFFQDLDKAIAKQEEKVNQLKESKQTLLRKMFI